MHARHSVAIVLTVLAYGVTTFAVQGISHFSVNAAHYAAIPIMRAEPVIAMGMMAMAIQGAILGVLFTAFHEGAATVWDGVKFSWMVGAFLASYIVLGEAGKYAIPSIPAWIAVEGGAAFVQFTVFGVLLGLIHRRKQR